MKTTDLTYRRAFLGRILGARRGTAGFAGVGIAEAQNRARPTAADRT